MNLVFGTMANLREELTQTAWRAELAARKEGFKPRSRGRELRACDINGELIEVVDFKGTQKEIIELQKTEGVERVFVEGQFETSDGEVIDGSEWSVMVSYGSAKNLRSGDVVKYRKPDGHWGRNATFAAFDGDDAVITTEDGESLVLARREVHLQRLSPESTAAKWQD